MRYSAVGAVTSAASWALGSLLLLFLVPAAAQSPPGAPNPKIDQTSSYTSSKTDVWVDRSALLSEQGIANWSASAIGYGDFNGDGITDIVVAPSSETRNPIPIHIFKGLGGGRYQEATSEIIAGPVPSTIHARKAIVADFNGDGRPDVYIADHGYDYPPFPGAKDVLLLSDGTGHLVWAKDQQEPVGFHHGAAAGDIRNTGKVDIFVTDSEGLGSYLLGNDGLGHFSIDYSGVPKSLKDKPLFTTELIDVDGDGYLDLIVGGHEFQGMTTSIFWGDGSGRYTDSNRTDLPGDAQYSVVLDFDAEDLDGDGVRDLVITRTGGDPFYQGYYFQVLKQQPKRIFADRSAQAIIGDRSTWMGTNEPWVDWIRLVDINGDGVPDILVDDAGRHLRWINDGSGKFTFVPRSFTPNLLLNGDFTAGRVGWQLPAGSSIEPTGPGGSPALRLTNTQPGRSVVADQWVVLDGSRYRSIRVALQIHCAGVVAGPNPQNATHVQVQFEDATGKILSFPDIVFGLTGTADWSMVQRDVSVPAGTARANLWLGLDDCVGTAWFADVRLMAETD
jgi:hypothetical protein